MPYGFSGNASEKYHRAVEDALSEAIRNHETNIYGSFNYPSSSARSFISNLNFMSVIGHFFKIGNKSNIVIDFDICQDLCQKIQMVDKAAVKELLDIALQIKEILDDFYIIPVTTPRISKLNNDSKITYTSVFLRTPDIETNMRNYSDTIVFKTA